MSKQSKYAIKAVIKALNILDLLGQKGGDASLTLLSKKLSIGKSTTHRLLSTLEGCNFVRQDPVTRKYSLGVKILELASLLMDENMLLKVGLPHLIMLRDKCGETVNLAVLEEDKVLYVGKEDSFEPLRITVEVGRRVPAHCTALGKVLLANLSDEQLSKIFGNQEKLKKMTENSVSDLARLKAHLEKVRTEGLARDYEECIPGIRCIGAPIRDFTGRVIAAVSIAGPTVRMSEERMNSFIPLLFESANAISRELGYRMVQKVMS